MLVKRWVAVVAVAAGLGVGGIGVAQALPESQACHVANQLFICLLRSETGPGYTEADLVVVDDGDSGTFVRVEEGEAKGAFGQSVNVVQATASTEQVRARVDGRSSSSPSGDFLRVASVVATDTNAVVALLSTDGENCQLLLAAPNGEATECPVPVPAVQLPYIPVP